MEGERGEGGPPCLFFENREKCPDVLGKKALIVSFFGLYFPF